MRGSLYAQKVEMDEFGIIPAHAGLTRAASQSALGVRDHPRACGAHAHTGEDVAGDTGSSPRMRGSRQFVARMT